MREEEAILLGVVALVTDMKDHLATFNACVDHTHVLRHIKTNNHSMQRQGLCLLQPHGMDQQT